MSWDRNVDGRPLSQWVEEFKKTVIDAEKELRIDEEIIGNIHDSRSDQIWRLRIERGSVTRVFSDKETTKLQSISVECSLDQWGEEPKLFPITSWLYESARALVEKEAFVTSECLLNEASELPSTGTSLAKADISKALNMVKSNQRFPDTLLISALRQKDLLSDLQWCDEEAQQNGKHYCGRMNGLITYWVPGMSEDWALIYEKKTCHLTRTPIGVNLGRPETSRLEGPPLILNQRRTAWFADKAASAKIRIR